MASRYFINGGVDSNWGSTSNWSTTSGGAGGSSVPTSSDAVFLDAVSPACVLNSVARVCQSLNCTGYTSTLTFDQELSVSGSITLVPGMTLAGTSTLRLIANGTLTTGGKVVNIPFAIQGVTATLGDNLTTSGLLTLGVNVSGAVLNNNTIYVEGSLTTSTAAAAGISGTSALVFSGTGTWSAVGAGPLKLNATINTPGTLTLSGTVYYNTGTLTYTTGTVITTGSTFATVDGGCTLNTNGIVWNNVDFAPVFGSTFTITLTSNFYVTGRLTLGQWFVDLVINGFTLYVSGSLRHGGPGIVSGTTALLLDGTGTWDATSTGALRNNLTINTAGTITVTGTVRYNTGTLTYTAGTVITTGSTLANSNVAVTLNTSGITWEQVALGGGVTVTLTSNLNVSVLATLGSIFVTTTINGFQLRLAGGLRLSSSSAVVTGSTSILLHGTGTWDQDTIPSTGRIANNVEINTAGTITIAAAVNYGGGTLTYTAGTVITTGSTLTILASSTLNTAGIVWNNFTYSVNATVTNSSALTIAGLALLGSGNNATVLNGANTIITGSLRFSFSGGAVSGTSLLQLAGTGTLYQSSSVTTGRASNNIEINTAGVVTISGVVNYGGGTITYAAGSVVATGSVLYLTGAATTLTINAADLVVGTLFLSSQNCTVNGSHGCTFEGILWRATGILSLKSTCTYVVRHQLRSLGVSGVTNSIVASVSSSAAFLIFQGLTTDLWYTSATDINSSGGKAIRTLFGTLTRTTNWQSVTQLERPMIQRPTLPTNWRD